MPWWQASNPNPADPSKSPQKPKPLSRREQKNAARLAAAKQTAERMNMLRGTGPSTRTKFGRKTGDPKYGQAMGPDEMTPCSKGVKKGQPGCGRAQGRPHVTKICGRRGKVKHGGL